MIRVTDRITRILGVLAALTLGVLLIAGRPPAPDTRATFAASAPAAMLGAVEAPASAPTTPTTPTTAVRSRGASRRAFGTRCAPLQ